jgi:hypothetical protein
LIDKTVSSRHRQSMMRFHPRATFFRAGLSLTNWGPMRRFLIARAERAAGHDERKRPLQALAGHACMATTAHASNRAIGSLMVKEKLNTFSPCICGEERS